MREFRKERLAPRTTLGVGGDATRLLELDSEAEVISALKTLRQGDNATVILGEGSNVVIADEGLDAVVLRQKSETITFEHPKRGEVLVHADGGVALDTLVERVVGEGLSGLEGLSGIPGSVGACPVQNVGAYGHQVSDHLQYVRVVDRERAEVLKLPTSACALAYRDSAFKGPWRDRYVITRVTFALNRGAPTTPRHGELASALNALGHMPTLAEIRETVLGLRRAKGMVYSPDDPQSHSAGSFFVNPVVTESDFATIRQGAKRAGFLGAEDHLPHYPADEGHVKLAAAWLIEHAGFPKGYVHGHVGLSTHHALAIVNRGGGKAHEIVALASAIQRAVWRHFGVTLCPEPVFLGLAAPTLDL